jgi:hypothetical protein
MVGVQGPSASNPRYYAYVHQRVLGNAAYAPNVVVHEYIHILWTIFIYYGLLSCIMYGFHVLWMI